MKRIEKWKQEAFKDLIVLSGTAGVVATAAKTVFSGIPYLMGITKTFGVLIAGKIVFHVRDVPMDAAHLLLALFTHLTFGGFLAVGLGLLYRFFGTAFNLLKGAFYGLIVWIIFRSYLVDLAVPGGPQPRDAVTSAVAFASHILYGVIAGYLIVKYYRFTPPEQHCHVPKHSGFFSFLSALLALFQKPKDPGAS
jgi:hypothetical protein